MNKIKCIIEMNNLISGSNNEKILLHQVELWKEIINTLTDFSIFTEYGEIWIQIDWSSALNYIEKFYSIEKEPIWKAAEIFEQNGSTYGDVKLECSINSNIIIENERRFNNQMIHYLEIFFYDVFLVANLAKPGSCNINAKIYIDNSYDAEISLDSYLLGGAWELSLDENWPQIKCLKFEDVWKWFKSLEMKYKQIADTRIEKVIFSFLNSCLESNISPSVLIWYTNILESLYHTSGTSIKHTLKDRIYLFLGRPPKYEQTTEKVLSLYETRNNFVHGSFSIHHPVQNEILDRKCDNYRVELMEQYTFAYSVIIATLQKIINNNWTGIGFKEKYFGVK